MKVLVSMWAANDRFLAFFVGELAELLIEMIRS